jgi:hypothetical protein
LELIGNHRKWPEFIKVHVIPDGTMLVGRVASPARTSARAAPANPRVLRTETAHPANHVSFWFVVGVFIIFKKFHRNSSNIVEVHRSSSNIIEYH